MMADYGFCPRCGARRPDAFRWCRKCGLDFQNTPSPDASSSAPVIASDQRTRVDVRPIGEQRDIAKWTRDAFTVRCLGTVGGIVGMVVGFFLFTAIGGAMNAGVASLLLGFLGIFVGFFFGVRLILGLLAR